MAAVERFGKDDAECGGGKGLFFEHDIEIRLRPHRDHVSYLEEHRKSDKRKGIRMR